MFLIYTDTEQKGRDLREEEKESKIESKKKNMADVVPSIEMQSKASKSDVVGKGLSWSNIRFEVPVRIFFDPHSHTHFDLTKFSHTPISFLLFMYSLTNAHAQLLNL